MIPYAVDGLQSVNFHYKTRLLSNYTNKLFYNIFEKGVIPDTDTFTVVDVNGDETSTVGTSIKISSGLSFFISPNNEFTSNITIQTNFNNMSATDQLILEKQILKCDIVKDFYVTPTTVESGWLVAEFNYLEFSDLSVEFSFVTVQPTDNRVILGEVTASGSYLTAIGTTDQEICHLNPNILYEMNADKLTDGVDNYDAGNSSGYIPISNGEMCLGLNTEMVNGYSGYEAAIKWSQNSGLNSEYIADQFGNIYKPSNSANSIPISNEIVNVNLNTEFVGGSGYTSFDQAIHNHYLDNLTDRSVIYKRPTSVGSDHLLTNDSFKNESFTSPKIANECFFANNDDDGGQLRILTGEVTLTKNYDTVPFSRTNDAVFLRRPDIMLQIIDDGTGNYDGYYIKLMAYDVSPSQFRVAYTIYSAVDGADYAEIDIQDLTIQYIAWGYVGQDVEY